MAHLVSVMGVSGSGKSSSLLPNTATNTKGLNPEETFIINVSGKPLPAKGSGKLYPLGIKPSEGGRHVEASKPEQIVQIIYYVNQNRPDIKNIVIDDMGYIMGFDVMENANKKGYDKWTQGAVSFMNVVNALKSCRQDLYCFCLFHTEIGKDEKTKIKTSGAMIDNNIYLDGLFTVNLEATLKKVDGENKFGFNTKPDEYSTRKSPAGMFEEEFIPNDLGFVKDKMIEYYE